jgi:hypothetical protein
MSLVCPFNACLVFWSTDAIAAAVQALKGEAKQAEEQASAKADKKAKKQKKKTIDFSKYRQRHVAFHVAYDGKRFSGFAAQGDEVGAWLSRLRGSG